MARLDAAADPAVALSHAFYEPYPGRSLSDQIAARLELQPASAQLVVGGVGSGKTTQLLVCERRLRALSDTTVVYVDVGLFQELNKLKAEDLLVIVGLKIVQTVSPTSEAAKKAAMQFMRWAHGYTYWQRLEDDYEPEQDDGDSEEPPEEPIYVPGVLSSPEPPPLSYSVQQKKDALNDLLYELRLRAPHVVLLVDSIDRILNPVTLEHLFASDVRVMRELGVGVVLVGPLTLLYGTQRHLTDRFDRYYIQPWIDVRQNVEGQAFLLRLLHRRDTGSLLAEAACRELAITSGGVLRDIIGLARNAGEEAYLSGDETVQPEHVTRAAESFGRALMLGVLDDELATLQNVRQHGVFVPRTDRDLSLLLTRRILEYRNGHTRYGVHPTIELLLEQLSALPR
jgi:hypothetical protein